MLSITSVVSNLPIQGLCFYIWKFKVKILTAATIFTCLKNCNHGLKAVVIEFCFLLNKLLSFVTSIKNSYSMLL